MKKPLLELPVSEFMSSDSKAAIKSQEVMLKEFNQCFIDLAGEDVDNPVASPDRRECCFSAFNGSKMEIDLRARYDVTMTPGNRGGVNTWEFMPCEGIEEKNKDRVLINLHGMLFNVDSRMDATLESIPIASVGKIKVISIDYRVAPEHFFPAASEDVATVYRDLLKTYKPENIGIYDSTALSLAAQSIAWFIKENLPIPGAIGMFGGGANRLDGDSMHISKAIRGQYYFELFDKYLTGVEGYFKNMDMNDPLVWPLEFNEMASQFPPSLLISATRAPLLSSIVYAHQKLTKLGVLAELHVWEGMELLFHQTPFTLESREAVDIVVQFFDKYLGSQT